MPHIEDNSKRIPTPPQPTDDDTLVETASEDSFPASDPPAWVPTTALGAAGESQAEKSFTPGQVNPTRIERDSMGDVGVPEDAYYGASTQRAVQNFFISCLKLPDEFIHTLGAI